jgi:hypothetical protein
MPFRLIGEDIGPNNSTVDRTILQCSAAVRYPIANDFDVIETLEAFARLHANSRYAQVCKLVRVNGNI